MKYFFSLIALFVLLSFRPSGDIYSVSIKDLDGNNIDLNQYKGKKVLFVVLSPSGGDTTITVNQITRLQEKYGSTFAVFGIPSIESGFNARYAGDLKLRYKDAHIVLTEGMRVKKGEQQSPLFQWLTNKDLNRHFNQDVEGVGSKFFVDEDGELYAVMDPKFALANPVIDKILTKQQRKKPLKEETQSHQ